MAKQASNIGFPSLIISQRIGLGIGQEQLAELTGVDVSTMSRIEAGTRLPTGAHTATLEIVLHIPKGILMKRLEQTRRLVEVNQDIGRELAILYGIELKHITYEY